MLEGIEVLSKSEIMTTPSWWWIPAVCILIFCIVTGVALSIRYQIDFLSFLFIGGIIVTGIYCLIVSQTVSTGEYSYKVTIDDSVSMTEFTERYEILDQDGKIYKIKEKKGD